MDNLSILIVDDEAIIRKEISIFLKRKTYAVYEAGLPSEAFNILKDKDVDIVILDVKLPEMSGIDVLQKIKSEYPDIEVIMITGHGDNDTILQSMRFGAFDFFHKPLTIIDIENSIRRTTKYIELNSRLKQIENSYNMITKEYQKEIGSIIGSSNAMKNIIDLVSKAGDSKDTSVLVTGESGTGKELIAKAIHYSSERKNNLFYTLNCSAIPESLIESELFGHIKGSFTGAIEDKMGCFEAGNHGTIFLDEIGDMPLTAQSKLLRVLEERNFRRIGSNKEITVDVRVISATNKDLKVLVDENKFRLDLLFRLNTFEINIPPLRERNGDIEILINYFMKYFSDKLNKSNLKMENNAFSLLKSYDYPGNVRELKNIIERAVIICDNGKIKSSHLSIVNNIKSGSSEISFNDLNLERMELNLINTALERTNNNISNASNLLGISRQALYRKIDKYKINIQV